MSTNFSLDIKKMHEKYDLHKHVNVLSNDKLLDLLEFRIKFINEELNELINNKNNPEEIVDALIDISVVALGTLDLFNVDIVKAWNEVYQANLNKKTGVKDTRPNQIIPDLIKESNWQAPNHNDNHGLFKGLKNDN